MFGIYLAAYLHFEDCYSDTMVDNNSKAMGDNYSKCIANLYSKFIETPFFYPVLSPSKYWWLA